MMSQAMTTLTATAARNGEPTAKIPKTISKTPQRIDNVEACRTISTGLCSAMETSSRRTELSLSQKTIRGSLCAPPPSGFFEVAQPSPSLTRRHQETHVHKEIGRISCNHKPARIGCIFCAIALRCGLQ